MRKLLIVSLGMTLALAALVSSPAHAASTAGGATLFGKDPGEDRAFACFTRHYDEAHLKAHPKQNVTDMSLLVDSTYDSFNDPVGRNYSLSIGVNFRKVDRPFDVSGSCSQMTEDNGLLHCGVDCDGGQIDVRLKDADSIVVEIPDGARVWDPSQSLDAEPDAGVVPEAAFGVDDKSFLLARASLKTCLDLLNADDKAMILAFSK
jgi:hypothetical protein